MDENSGLDAATRQIRKIHSRGGRPLTKSEAIALIEHLKHVYMGVPKPGPRNKRGRKPKTQITQYDVLHERLRGPKHRLIKLPSLRSGARTIPHEAIEYRFQELLSQGTPPRKLVSTVLAELQRKKGPLPDVRTLRRILERIRPNFPK